MKIAILTFWSSNDNYGQLLQCYALQKYLKDLGHEVFTIRYHRKNALNNSKLFFKKILRNLNPVYLIKKCIRKNNLKKIYYEEQKFNRQFDLFRQRYITFSKDYYFCKDLKNNPPDADIYIVGSDQVWNEDLIKFSTGNYYPAYFLDFGSKNIKRLAYAVSFGKENLSASYSKYLHDALKKFDYISVREQNGIKLCNQLGISDVEFVCDPTLLVSADSYRKIYNENRIEKREKRFLLLYILNNTFKFDLSKVYNFATSKKLEVVFVSGNGLVNIENRTFPTIPEWLWLIDNAEYIITNSYHCSIFSTIFHKQFGIIPLTGKQIGMNQRFYTLFQFLGTGERFIYENDFSILDKTYNKNEVIISNRFLSFFKE